jgi:hypothetical protein
MTGHERREMEALLAFARAVGNLRDRAYQQRLHRLRRAKLRSDAQHCVVDLPQPAFLEAAPDSPLIDADRTYVGTLVNTEKLSGPEGGWWLSRVIAEARTAGDLQAVLAGFLAGRSPDAAAYPELTVALLQRSAWQRAWYARSANLLSKVEYQQLRERIDATTDVATLEKLAAQLPADSSASTGGGAQGGNERRDEGPATVARQARPNLGQAKLPDRKSQLRISHADRQEASQMLALAFGDGRLTSAEYETRLGMVQSAKTYGDLLPLIVNLDALASDAERRQVMLAIEAAGRAGLLEPVERLDRLQAVQTATTDAELAGLSADLRPTPTDRHLARVADADRDRVVLVLRVALGEGRLTLDEYDERVKRAYAARRFFEFEPLLVDLPTPTLGHSP